MAVDKLQSVQLSNRLNDSIGNLQTNLRNNRIYEEKKEEDNKRYKAEQDLIAKREARVEEDRALNLADRARIDATGEIQLKLQNANGKEERAKILSETSDYGGIDNLSLAKFSQELDTFDKENESRDARNKLLTVQTDNAKISGDNAILDNKIKKKKLSAINVAEAQEGLGDVSVSKTKQAVFRETAERIANGDLSGIENVELASKHLGNKLGNLQIQMDIDIKKAIEENDEIDPRFSELAERFFNSDRSGKSQIMAELSGMDRASFSRYTGKISSDISKIQQKYANTMMQETKNSEFFENKLEKVEEKRSKNRSEYISDVRKAISGSARPNDISDSEWTRAKNNEIRARIEKFDSENSAKAKEQSKLKAKILEKRIDAKTDIAVEKIKADYKSKKELNATISKIGLEAFKLKYKDEMEEEGWFSDFDSIKHQETAIAFISRHLR